MIYISLITVLALVIVATAVITEAIATKVSNPDWESDALELLENDWREN